MVEVIWRSLQSCRRQRWTGHCKYRVWVFGKTLKHIAKEFPLLITLSCHQNSYKHSHISLWPTAVVNGPNRKRHPLKFFFFFSGAEIQRCGGNKITEWSSSFSRECHLGVARISLNISKLKHSFVGRWDITENDLHQSKFRVTRLLHEWDQYTVVSGVALDQRHPHNAKKKKKEVKQFTICHVCCYRAPKKQHTTQK